MKLAVDWTKLLAVLAFLASLTILLGLGRVVWDDVQAIFLLLVGYIVGNGRATAKGVASKPIIGPGNDNGAQ